MKPVIKSTIQTGRNYINQNYSNENQVEKKRVAIVEML